MRGLTKHMGSLFIAQILGKQPRKKKTLFSWILCSSGEKTVYKPVYKKISTGEEGKVQGKDIWGLLTRARKGKAT